ncbi:MAG: alpha/beta hydrolase [Chitinophagales bacterium]|nr:alpha/beta hydrolase [Chitinophagales bacterium]
MRLSILTLLLSMVMLNVQAQLKVAHMSEVDYGVQTQTISLGDDVTLAYTDQGKGAETIIFIHGLASYIPAWKKNIEDLKSDYRCIAIDLPGYGKSSKGNYKVSMDFFADKIHEFCQKLGLKQVILAGHSMGGQIAISTALKYPEFVSKLILIAPAGFETFNKGERQWFRDAMTVDGVKLTTVEQIRVNYAYNFYNMPKDAEFMVDDRIAIRHASDFQDYCYHVTQGVQAMVDSPVFDFLPNVKQKTLCVFGENDNLIPNRYLNGGPTKKYAKMGAERMPNCDLKMINKAGHFVMFEKAEEVNMMIRSFLK